MSKNQSSAAQESQAHIIDGRAIARRVKNRVGRAVKRLLEDDIVPHLTVIRVGDDSSSAIYVRNKRRAAKRLGIRTTELHLPATTSTESLHQTIERLNDDDDVDAILLQLPLPKHLAPRTHIEAIDPEKDADGFHPMNVGRLIVWDVELRPCTPAGILEILLDQEITIRGRHAVVISRSVVVGRPTAQLLLKYGATVTVCHRLTENLSDCVSRADILVSATGQPELVKGDWLKPGATVIDVGITRMEDGSLKGDVEFETAVRRAGAITPVPGGVGPLTIAMLMRNTAIAARLRRRLDPDPDLAIPPPQ